MPKVSKISKRTKINLVRFNNLVELEQYILAQKYDTDVIYIDNPRYKVHLEYCNNEVGIFLNEYKLPTYFTDLVKKYGVFWDENYESALYNMDLATFRNVFSMLLAQGRLYYDSYKQSN